MVKTDPVIEFIRNRFRSMALRAPMWATTRMDFGLQVATLVEVYLICLGFSDDHATRVGYQYLQRAMPMRDDNLKLTDEWAEEVIKGAFEVLDGQTP